MKAPITVRAVEATDFDAWLPLWDGYNAFYGRSGDKSIAPEITRTTWQRFLDPAEPVFALVAEREGRLAGLVHFLHHRSTTRIEPVCYLQDLFTQPDVRGRGVGRALIEAVYERASGDGIRRVYWLTHESNVPGRRLYDRIARHGGFIVYGHEI